jgi:hypothetical protein
MGPNLRHRRVVAAALIFIASLPFMLTAIFVASSFVLPSVFWAMFDRLVPFGVDAPDNWALAITRIAYGLVICSSVSLAVGAFGWRLLRSPIETPGHSIAIERPLAR